MSCAVCAKHSNLEGLPGGVIFQNDLIFVAHFPFQETAEKRPHYGHIILELKRHITSPREMTEDEASTVGVWLQRISEFLETKLGAEHTYLFRIGDVTPHLHFHAVPRFPETPRDMWGIYLYENPLGRKAQKKDIEDISHLMHSEFSMRSLK